ncbi:MAG: tetratricopeptide repeat protein [Acidobacteria bacterium]|nr:tetratricopeptide repeat protein [Acidobacteriota bacterium]MCA1648837.1 tetratricopeptide repeat protein [Acidobacteriota bacterium]
MRAILLACLFAVMAAPAAAGARHQKPDSTAGYYFLLGRHLESAGKIDEAIDAHKRAIELDPTSAELHAELAGLFARQDRVFDSVRAAEAALERDPANREANRILGSIYAALVEQRRKLRAGDVTSQYASRAIASLEKARREGVPDAGLELTLGRLYVQTRAYTQAIPALRRVVDDQPGYTDAAFLLAMAQEAVGEPDAAISTLETTLLYSPSFFRGRVRVAELHEKQGRWTEAAAAYAKAQALNTAASDLTARRAAALINAGRAAEARVLLQPAAEVATPPTDPAVLYLLAVSQRQVGDLAAAEMTANRLRALAPEDVRGLYVIAQIRDAKGDAPGAERALRDLLAKDPVDATALNYLGYMLAERGERLDEAIELVQRALKVEPANPSFLDSLGWAYYRQGKLDLADPALTEAAGKLPRSSVVNDHLGDLRFKQKRYAHAAAAWERSLAGDGESINRAEIEKKLQEAKARQ